MTILQLASWQPLAILGKIGANRSESVTGTTRTRVSQTFILLIETYTRLFFPVAMSWRKLKLQRHWLISGPVRHLIGYRSKLGGESNRIFGGDCFFSRFFFWLDLDMKLMLKYWRTTIDRGEDLMNCGGGRFSVRLLYMGKSWIFPWFGKKKKKRLTGITDCYSLV